MSSAKSMPTPMTVTSKLSKDGHMQLYDPKLYRMVVGSLQYVPLTHPEIAYSVNKVCQFMNNPLEEHWTATKRILRYLASTSHYGLLIQKSNDMSIRSSSDADWGRDLDDRHSTSGSSSFIASNLVSWFCKKQPVVSRSSTKAEFRSLAATIAKTLLKELGVTCTTKPLFFCDNMSAVFMAQNPVQHTKTKHVEIDIFYVRERVVSGEVEVAHIF